MLSALSISFHTSGRGSSWLFRFLSASYQYFTERSKTLRSWGAEARLQTYSVFKWLNKATGKSCEVRSNQRRDRRGDLVSGFVRIVASGVVDWDAQRQPCCCNVTSLEDECCHYLLNHMVLHRCMNFCLLEEFWIVYWSLFSMHWQWLRTRDFKLLKGQQMPDLLTMCISTNPCLVFSDYKVCIWLFLWLTLFHMHLYEFPFQGNCDSCAVRTRINKH